MNKIAFTILFLSSSFLAFSQDGIYLTYDDYKNGKLSKEGEVVFCNGSKLTLEVNGVKEKYKVSEMWAYVRNGKTRRSVNGSNYYILDNTGEIIIYGAPKPTGTGIYMGIHSGGPNEAANEIYGTTGKNYLGPSRMTQRSNNYYSANQRMKYDSGEGTEGYPGYTYYFGSEPNGEVFNDKARFLELIADEPEALAEYEKQKKNKYYKWSAYKTGAFEKAARKYNEIKAAKTTKESQ